MLTRGITGLTLEMALDGDCEDSSTVKVMAQPKGIKDSRMDVNISNGSPSSRPISKIPTVILGVKRQRSGSDPRNSSLPPKAPPTVHRNAGGCRKNEREPLVCT